MKIVIETIKHEDQRYPTVGDWQFLQPPFCKEGDLGIVIYVSELSDWRREVLVAVHELVEVLTCKQDGVTQDQVDLFDMQFEAKRQAGDVSEPGDSSEAPYHKQHVLATSIEKTLAAALGVDWNDYDKEVSDL